MKRPLVLVILDGWGIGKRHTSNPVYVVQPPHINTIKHTYLSGSLQASGIAVGLPWGEVGNSEVGHLTIGAGKVIYQHYPRITLAIERGLFAKNTVLTQAFDNVNINKKTVHLIGLLSQGNVHASFDHIEALLCMAHERKTENVALHLFTDGKDGPPQSFLDLLEKLRIMMKTYEVGRIASLSGRYYAMDRDNRWDRTEKAYRAMTGVASLIGSERCDEYAVGQYAKGLSDEFIEPVTVTPELAVKNGDALIFFNFREDSIRQIAESFASKDFSRFPRSIDPETLTIVTFTHYADSIQAQVAFPSETITAPLGKVLADNNMSQLRVAETKKYAHVTYFFNGLQEAPFQNEHRVLIPSKNVARDDDAPEMMAHEITTRIVSAIENGGFDVIIANYANADMIAHTGNYEAAKAAVTVIDEEIGALTESILANNAVLMITADHGNVERMFNPATGMPETQHDPSPVPFYLIGKEFKREKYDGVVEEIERGTIGILSDVAPTILALMDLPKPESMTGRSLLSSLR